ncbi:MAG: VCBS repeat-containing protein [Candidatus Eisenbacteria sp.]|nr:VCBS repeat-containing protein [Candidatus Eisenbacteria bacterium]
MLHQVDDASSREQEPPAALSRLLAVMAVILLPALPALATMPLATSPAWQSAPDGHYATGGAWVDVDSDGWLDMVVSNGNDMARQHLVIYHNNGDGTFPEHPTWSSDDVDYHGHLDIGDLNNDGLPDVAVAVYIGPAGFSEPGRVKVYLNNGVGAFSSAPDWTPAEDFYCFSVALGDVDGDGDLDLACACGDDYNNHAERQRIYYNDNGVLEAMPSWCSDEIAYALDVFWGDIEEDGDMDVVFCGTSTPMRVYLNEQTTGGSLSTSASWESGDLPQFGNTTALGDWNGDGFPEIAVADNNQLGGPGRFKVYANVGGSLGSIPAWTSSNGGYGSHVSWIDADLDGDPDLAAGRWWGTARIFENLGGELTTTPVWTSATTSVIENMFWGDIDNDALYANGQTIASGDGSRTFFYLGRAPVRQVDEILVGSTPLPATAYTSHPTNGWVSVATPPPPGSNNVEILFSYSIDLDLGITNWDSSVGNYLFLSSASMDVPGGLGAAKALCAFPNPALERTWIRYQGQPIPAATLMVYDATGRLVRALHDGPISQSLLIWEWDRRDDQGRRLEAGVYFGIMAAGEVSQTLRLVLLQ